MNTHNRETGETRTRARARELRHNQTPAERRLWARLRDHRLTGFKFRRQHDIGLFIVDFYCASCKLIVEVDGDSHVARTEYDTARTEWLEAQGYRVIRFTNREVTHQLDAVLNAIHEACTTQTIPPLSKRDH